MKNLIRIFLLAASFVTLPAFSDAGGFGPETLKAYQSFKSVNDAKEFLLKLALKDEREELKNYLDKITDKKLPTAELDGQQIKIRHNDALVAVTIKDSQRLTFLIQGKIFTFGLTKGVLANLTSLDQILNARSHSLRLILLPDAEASVLPVIVAATAVILTSVADLQVGENLKKLNDGNSEILRVCRQEIKRPVDTSPTIPGKGLPPSVFGFSNDSSALMCGDLGRELLMHFSVLQWRSGSHSSNCNLSKDVMDCLADLQVRRGTKISVSVVEKIESIALKNQPNLDILKSEAKEKTKDAGSNK